MAQTTDGMSFMEATVNIGTNGTVWTDISGFSTSVKVGGGKRKTGEKPTFAGDYPIVTVGRREKSEATVSIVYTEGVSDAYAMVEAAYENHTLLYMKWAPKGGQTGERVYTISGYVTNPPYPSGDSDSADPILCEFTIEGAVITHATA